MPHRSQGIHCFLLTLRILKGLKPLLLSSWLQGPRNWKFLPTTDFQGLCQAMWVSGRVDGKFSYLQMHFLFKEWFPWPSLKTVLQMYIQIYSCLSKITCSKHGMGIRESGSTLGYQKHLSVNVSFRNFWSQPILCPTQPLLVLEEGISLLRLRKDSKIHLMWDTPLCVWPKCLGLWLYCASKYFHSACM